MAKDYIFELIEAEKTRQKEGLELIPSENYVSGAVLEAMGSVLTNKYSEGYPSFTGVEYEEKSSATNDAEDGGSATSNTESGNSATSNAKSRESAKSERDAKEYFQREREVCAEILPNYRYYGGQQNTDRVERVAIMRACELFHADHANVQPHSGANANEAAYFAWCEPGDKILAMNLGHGGHLTHGAPVTRSAKIYNFIAYGTDAAGDIDYAELERLARKEQPKIILVGYSAFMKVPDFARVVKIAKEVEKEAGHEILLMADMAHVAGLIAGGVHPNPLDYGFQVMTTTTHKTLRGPRGGLILSKGRVASPLKKPEKTLENLPILIDRAVFPGTQGGPLMHVIAAKAVAFGEALQPEFQTYAERIVENAKVLAEELAAGGFILQGGGTENHLVLVNVEKSFGVGGKFYERALDLVGLTLNANALPGDKGGAFKPGGVRLGTPAITTRGMGVAEMRQIAQWMKQVVEICAQAGTEERLEKFGAELEGIREEVRGVALRFPVPGV